MKNRPPAAGIANENFLNSDRYFGKYKIESPEELQARCDAYFKKCDEHTEIQLLKHGLETRLVRVPAPKPYTWTGLARAVGLSGRQALLNYAKRDGYGEVLEEARMILEEEWEGLLARQGNNGSVQYNLENSRSPGGYNWKNTKEINLGGQEGNPLKVEHLDHIPYEKLKQMEALLDGDETDYGAGD